MSEARDGLSRRDFLKGSVVTAAAIGLGTVGVFSHAKAEMIGPNDTINAAFIGVGAEGSMLLGKGVNVPNVKWVACCDIQPSHLKNGLNIAKGAEGYEDYHRLLERKDIQAICTAVPLALHAPLAIEALKAGKHVFSEKMMAYTIEDAKRMARAAQQAGKKLQIGHQRRSNPTYQHARKMIQDGMIGELTSVEAVWNRNASWRRPVPKDSTEELTNWRLYRKFSHGLMAELGSHQIDVVNWMVGEVPSAVVGIGGLDHYKDGRDILDNVQVIFKYPGGVKMTFQSLTTNQFSGCHEKIMGTKGTVILSEGAPSLLYHEPKTDEEVWESMAHKETVDGKSAIVLDASKSPRMLQAAAQGTTIAGEDNLKKSPYLLELEDFFLSIRDGHVPLCSPQIGLETCVAAIKANNAMDSQKWLDIPAEMYKI